MAQQKPGTKKQTDGSSALRNSGSAVAADGAEPSHSDRRSKPATAPLAAGLHLVATPIGNAADITLRALDALRAADLVVCEDTRVTSKLLAIHGIKASLLSYHEHNAEKVRPGLIKRLKDGERVAMVSDAGTPLVSDPGYKLIRDCLDEGVAFTTLPGPSAVLASLVLSGLPTDRFLFAGFPPSKGGARRRFMEQVAGVPATLIFLESAKRLGASLADMAAVLGDREAAVARELTKKFEEVRRGSLADLAVHYAEAGPPKGEVSVVVGPPPEAAAVTEEDLDELLRAALKSQSIKDAAAGVAAATGLPKRRVYARALELKDGGG